MNYAAEQAKLFKLEGVTVSNGISKHVAQSFGILISNFVPTKVSVGKSVLIFNL